MVLWDTQLSTGGETGQSLVATDTNSDIPRNCWPRVLEHFETNRLSRKIPSGTFLGTVRTLSPCLVMPRQCFPVFKIAYLVGFYFSPFVLTQYATSHTHCQLAEFNHKPHTVLSLRPRQSCIFQRPFSDSPDPSLSSDHWALSFGPSLV